MTELSLYGPGAVPQGSGHTEIIWVPFLNGHIPCIEVDGEPMVIPKPISDLMGLRWAGQYTKLSADQTACIQFIYIQLPGDNQARKNMVIGLETFTLWIGGIQPSRVAPEARDTVIAYRREAGRKLRDYFFGKSKQVATALGDPLEEIERQTRLTAQAVEIARAERAARERAELESAELREENAAMLPAVEAWETMIDSRGFIPMAVFAQQSGIIRPENGKPLGQNTATEILREIGILKDAPGTEQHNTPYQQHAHRIVSRSEHRGPVRVNVPYVVPAHAQYLASRIYEYLYPGYERLPKSRVVEKQPAVRRRATRASVTR